VSFLHIHNSTNSVVTWSSVELLLADSTLEARSTARSHSLEAHITHPGSTSKNATGRATGSTAGSTRHNIRRQWVQVAAAARHLPFCPSPTCCSWQYYSRQEPQAAQLRVGRRQCYTGRADTAARRPGGPHTLPDLHMRKCDAVKAPCA
jgi:hypothetical protein